MIENYHLNLNLNWILFFTLFHYFSFIQMFGLLVSFVFFDYYPLSMISSSSSSFSSSSSSTLFSLLIHYYGSLWFTITLLALSLSLPLTSQPIRICSKLQLFSIRVVFLICLLFSHLTSRKHLENNFEFFKISRARHANHWIELKATNATGSQSEASNTPRNGLSIWNITKPH